jgi:cytochrome c peroxidase
MTFARSLSYVVILLVIGSAAVVFGRTLMLQHRDLTPQEELGRLLYFDANLSTPPGQSCASCHHPSAGFADPDHNLPVSQGALPHRFGNRNSPTSAYAAFSPNFHYDETEDLYVGGQFWDGRALNLTEQAKGPFLNPLEMHNPNKVNVIVKVRQASYAGLFEEVYGPGALDNVEMAYNQVAEAIAVFEATSDLNQFSSKYDLYLQSQAELTEQELWGLQLFNDPMKGNCAACHPSEPGPYSEHALFTDFSYDNLGVPKNWENPFLYLPPSLNPDGQDFIDYGLGGILGEPDEMGKMKVPTLRNIGMTSPYMHNGIFQTLHQVVDFYNTRDVPEADWPPPEVPETVNHDELGDLGLTDAEVDAIVAFLMTLTDGYVPMEGIASDVGGSAGVVVTPIEFAVGPNYPNPFNPTTTIQFALPKGSETRLAIYDISGRLVTTLLNGWQDAGTHAVRFDGSNLASGIYLYRLNAGEFVGSGKMILAK